MSDDLTNRQPDDEQERPSPFPDSSLGVPPSDPPYGHPQPPPLPDTPPAQADPPPGADPVSDPADPAPSPGERWASPSPPPPPSPGEGWAAPSPPPPPGPSTPPVGAGFSSGDPLGGSSTPGFTHGDPLGVAPGTPAPPPSAPSYPQGYTSPPPPGAGGFPPTAQPSFGAPGAGTYVLSGWWRRVGAALIDGLIIGVVAMLIMAPLGIGVFSVDETDSGGFIALVGAFLLAALVIAVVALAYAPVMMGMTNGKTVGRMATGIRVVRANGQRMTFGWAALREVAVKALLINGVAGSFTFGLAGLLDVLWPLWDDQNRALHDFVTDTRTVID